MQSRYSRRCARRESRLPSTESVPLDSGVPRYLSKEAKKMLDAEGFTDAVISASNDLDETLITSLKNQGATINSWGVGTNLITSKDSRPFGGVYKLAAIMDKKTGNLYPEDQAFRERGEDHKPGQ